MKIEQVTKTVFVGYDEREYLTEKEAIDSFLEAGKAEARNQLVEMLDDVGPFYEYDTGDAADVLIKNAELVIALLRKASASSEPRADVRE